MAAVCVAQDGPPARAVRAAAAPAAQPVAGAALAGVCGRVYGAIDLLPPCRLRSVARAFSQRAARTDRGRRQPRESPRPHCADVLRDEQVRSRWACGARDEAEGVAMTLSLWESVFTAVNAENAEIAEVVARFDGRLRDSVSSLRSLRFLRRSS